MRRRLLPLSVLVLALALPQTSAVGDDGPAPTTILQFDAATLTGTVDWGGQAPVVLGQDLTGDSPASRSDLDVTSIAAWIEDGDVPVMTFAWRLRDLTDAPPPEVVRYYWQFGVGAGRMALQAKTSDFVSAANAASTPQGVIANATSYTEHYQQTGDLPQFRIRGNCETIVAVNSCGHVAWADGAFDVAGDEIRFHVPLDSDATPALRPGARLAPDDNGAYSAIQAGADNAQTRDTVAQTVTYTIPERTATATLTAEDGTTTVVAMTIGEDGAISAAGPLAVPAGVYDVEVRACFAGSCDTASGALDLT